MDAIENLIIAIVETLDFTNGCFNHQIEDTP